MCKLNKNAWSSGTELLSDRYVYDGPCHTPRSAALMAETLEDWLVFSCSAEEAGMEVGKAYPLTSKTGGK